MVIRDLDGHDWDVRIDQLPQGWEWIARRWDGVGHSAGLDFFNTEAEARANAEGTITAPDFRRVWGADHA